MSLTDDAPDNTFDRRTAIKGGAAGVAAIALASLATSPAGANLRTNRSVASNTSYGPLQPTKDEVTGLELLALPAGFRYQSYGWTGQIMADGRPTPTDHDGMAVVDRSFKGGKIVLVRNHENSEGEGPQAFVDGGMYNPAQFGGTTNLVFNQRKGTFVESWTSLGGTIRNCAGGPTPWRSWISCEETFHPWGEGPQGFNHGYIFDVPRNKPSDGQPIRAAGRFSHEAVAVDPWNGTVYETEDARVAGFYAYRNPGGYRRLRDGGELYALAIKGAPSKDLRGSFQMGDVFETEWVEVADPEGQVGTPFESAAGAAIFSRLEGVWYSDDREIIFISTDGGDAGLGQVWSYSLKDSKLRLIYESTDPQVLDGPDNVTVAPSGGLLLCEDGDSNPKRMIGLSPEGGLFEFCRNNVELVPGDIDTIDAAFPGTKANFWDDPVGDFRSREWAGADFHGQWLFANIQSPGITFAITGPWQEGPLGARYH